MLAPLPCTKPSLPTSIINRLAHSRIISTGSKCSTVCCAPLRTGADTLQSWVPTKGHPILCNEFIGHSSVPPANISAGIPCCLPIGTGASEVLAPPPMSTESSPGDYQCIHRCWERCWQRFWHGGHGTLGVPTICILGLDIGRGVKPH